VDYQGHQIFIVHPDKEICKQLVRTLRRKEYETYGISDLKTDISVMQRDTVIFLKISENDSWNWRHFASLVFKLNISLRIVALAGSEIPDGFDRLIEASDYSACEPILNYLEEHDVQGHRHFVRFGSQFASIATFNFHSGDRLFAGIIHDLSSTGVSCTFKPEPEVLEHQQVDIFNLNISGYRISLSGSFASKRVVAGQIIHVFNFEGSIPDEAMDHIYDFIYSSLETRLSLH